MMLTVTTYGRILVRVIANSITQGEFEYVPISYPFGRRAIQSCSYSSPVKNSVNPCQLVSAISGFSKFDSPSRRTSRIPPAAAAISDKKLFGDDAYFVTSSDAADVLGVSDGVGGWRRHGIDPSLFSSKLMAACEMLVKTENFVPSKPSDLLASGYQELLEDKSEITGSGTACIVAVDRNKQSLHTANLGDSGFMVVRRGSVVHRSNEQQHAFNTPYQLSIPPEEQAGLVLQDNAEDAETTSFDLELGDIILTATDGLFDNLPESLILRELAKLQDSNEESVKRTAWSIAEQALENAFDPDYMSPFSKQARRHGYTSTKGGKPDDITVLLSMLTTAVD